MRDRGDVEVFVRSDGRTFRLGIDADRRRATFQADDTFARRRCARSWQTDGRRSASSSRCELVASPIGMAVPAEGRIARRRQPADPLR